MIFKKFFIGVKIRILKILNKNRGYFNIAGIKMYLDFLDPIDRELVTTQKYEEKEICFLGLEIYNLRNSQINTLNNEINNMKNDYNFLFDVKLEIKDEFVNNEKVGMRADAMAKAIGDSIEECFLKWSPKEKYTLEVI